MSDIIAPPKKYVKVWDRYTRLFHWALAISILISFISEDQGDMETHVISGIVVLGLVAFRILWGLMGARTAQFWTFIRGPGKIIDYLRNSKAPEFTPMIGHSPLGALSVIALLISVGVQAVTGLFATDDIYTEGPLEKFVTSDFSRWATSVHDTNSDILLVLIGLHIAAIFYYLIFRNDNLVGPMVGGDKLLPAEEADQTEPVRERNPVIAATAIFAAAAIAYYIYTI